MSHRIIIGNQVFKKAKGPDPELVKALGHLLDPFRSKDFVDAIGTLKIIAEHSDEIKKTQNPNVLKKIIGILGEVGVDFIDASEEQKDAAKRFEQWLHSTYAHDRMLYGL